MIWPPHSSLASSSSPSSPSPVPQNLRVDFTPAWKRSLFFFFTWQTPTHPSKPRSNIMSPSYFLRQRGPSHLCSSVALCRSISWPRIMGLHLANDALSFPLLISLRAQIISCHSCILSPGPGTAQLTRMYMLNKWMGRWIILSPFSPDITLVHNSYHHSWCCLSPSEYSLLFGCLNNFTLSCRTFLQTDSKPTYPNCFLLETRMSTFYMNCWELYIVKRSKFGVILLI